MNFVFISPHFPHTYWNYCDRLKKNGVNVLGIGDAEYDSLSVELKQSLTEYYKVNNMENYDEMLRAVAYFAFRYGKIDWIESNTEYWLETDAHLRTDFHVTTGVNAEEVKKYKSKFDQKKYYAEAGVPTARCMKLTSKEEAESFIEEVKYPVFVKPDTGAGASHSYKLESKADFEKFFSEKPDEPFVMEEFVTGDIFSYDAIIDSKGEPLYESSTAWPPSVADIVNDQLDLGYYHMATLPTQLKERGRATVKAFQVKNRFVHLEFFCLTEDKPGLGESGDFVGLEVNMRPAGGYTADMMNYAHETDVYQIWADMVTADQRFYPETNAPHCCVYAGRRDCHEYLHSEKEIWDKYGDKIVMAERIPGIWTGAMGDSMFTAHAIDENAAYEMIAYVQAKKG